jgi:hypothetical protein
MVGGWQDKIKAKWRRGEKGEKGKDPKTNDNQEIESQAKDPGRKSLPGFLMSHSNLSTLFIAKLETRNSQRL